MGLVMNFYIQKALSMEETFGMVDFLTLKTFAHC